MLRCAFVRLAWRRRFRRRRGFVGAALLRSLGRRAQRAPGPASRRAAPPQPCCSPSGVLGAGRAHHAAAESLPAAAAAPPLEEREPACAGGKQQQSRREGGRRSLPRPVLEGDRDPRHSPPPGCDFHLGRRGRRVCVCERGREREGERGGARVGLVVAAPGKGAIGAEERAIASGAAGKAGSRQAGRSRRRPESAVDGIPAPPFPEEGPPPWATRGAWTRSRRTSGRTICRSSCPCPSRENWRSGSPWSW